jgi:hypothetical protein
MLKKRFYKNISIILGLLTFISVGLTMVDYQTMKKEEGSVKSLSDSITVNVTIRGCILDIKAHMERRHQENMSTILNIRFYEKLTDNFYGDLTVTTDSDGEAVVNACNEGLYLDTGEYYTRVRGFSHLVKEFEDIAVITNVTDLDYTNSETFEFFAGETSNIFDNKINSLDLSTQIEYLYSNNYKNDLNQDGKVNSLDISNTIDNFYLEGDE